MAAAGDTADQAGFMQILQKPGIRNLFLALGAAAVMAVMAGVWMWGQQPEYRVLFSNFSDKDGGAIVAALQQMNVPYKFSEGGVAILVPAPQVHDARLKLASQGLPRGGGVGFELMENQKLGVSQFLEQVNFQRALEGELARSIQSIGQVQAARVHLAIPKATVFVRDQQKPTASVLLNLHPGRSLDAPQVSAIVHLVASSVPNLPPDNVTVVDQNGSLLSARDKPAGAPGLDASQLKYVQELQQNIARRIESILTPIVGERNVRAEATADVDFSRSEQAAETYRPNQGPNAAAIRSQQSSESQQAGSGVPAGVPGALSNQPPGPASAPLTAPATASGTNPAAPPATPPLSANKENTVNYEVDKTISYVQQPMGGIRRLSVAVVVNYREKADAAGKTSMQPLSDTERTQITELVKQAMGYSQDRGDTLNVVNSPFAQGERSVLPQAPLWERPETLQTAREVGKYLLAAVVLLYLFFAVLRPTLKTIRGNLAPQLPAPEDPDVVVQLTHEEPLRQQRGYQENLEAAKLLARQDPKVVANVVKSWVGGNE
jgi:flagellar M-ring protein FliF